MTKTVLKKGRTVKVETKKGGQYSFKFTTLAQIHEWLEENNLHYEAFIKNENGQDYLYIQKLKKEGDEWVKDGEPLQEARVPQAQGAHEYGGLLTSVRRFSLLMAYGLACEDDVAPASGSVEETQEKWKKAHTPDPSKPASEKQIDTIRKLAARAGKTLDEMNKMIAYAKNQALASGIINKLGEEIKRKENQ